MLIANPLTLQADIVENIYTYVLQIETMRLLLNDAFVAKQVTKGQLEQVLLPNHLRPCDRLRWIMPHCFPVYVKYLSIF